jgi:hypothetical protein
MPSASATAQIGFSRAVINGNLRDVAKLGGPRSVQLAVARPAYFSLSRKRHACVGSGMVPGIMVMPQNGLFPQRDQALLLPVDVGEWLPEDHLAFVVLDAVATLDLASSAAVHLSRRRCDLARLAADAAESLAGRFEAAGITLERRLTTAGIIADARWPAAGHAG